MVIQVSLWSLLVAIFFFAYMGFRWSTSTFINAIFKIALFGMCFVFIYYIFEK
jgi:hypothetical protein